MGSCVCIFMGIVDVDASGHHLAVHHSPIQFIQFLAMNMEAYSIPKKATIREANAFDMLINHRRFYSVLKVDLCFVLFEPLETTSCEKKTSGISGQILNEI